MIATNMSSFIGGQREGAVKETVINPITVDYMLGAYLTGILQYPVDIIEGFIPRDKLKGERVQKREDESDLSSFKNAASIVTRRFKVANPIKNSSYHKQWQKIINRAKKLKQIDVTQMDLDKRNETFLIGLYGRTMDKLAEGYEAGIEPEVLVFSGLSDILKEGEQYLIESRQQRNVIMASDFDGETKRKQIDELIKLENYYLKSVIDNLASMPNIDFIFDETYKDRFKEYGVLTGLLTLPFRTAKDAFKPNPREQ